MTDTDWDYVSQGDKKNERNYIAVKCKRRNGETLQFMQMSVRVHSFKLLRKLASTFRTLT